MDRKPETTNDTAVVARPNTDSVAPPATEKKEDPQASERPLARRARRKNQIGLFWWLLGFKDEEDKKEEKENKSDEKKEDKKGDVAVAGDQERLAAAKEIRKGMQATAFAECYSSTCNMVVELKKLQNADNRLDLDWEKTRLEDERLRKEQADRHAIEMRKCDIDESKTKEQGRQHDESLKRQDEDLRLRAIALAQQKELLDLKKLKLSGAVQSATSAAAASNSALPVSIVPKLG